MAGTAQERATVALHIVNDPNADAASKQLAIEAAMNPPDAQTTNDLWRYLIVGLLFLTLVALGGVLYLLADGDKDTSPDIALTAFTALLTGLLGLFVKSPAQG
jgi:hypothetical protein